jgi:hypothetical protein
MEGGNSKGIKKVKKKTTSTKNKTKKRNEGSSTSRTSSSSISQKGEDKTAKTLSEKKNIEDGPVLTAYEFIYFLFH